MTMVKLSFFPITTSVVSIPRYETEIDFALAFERMLNSPFFPVRVDPVAPLMSNAGADQGLSGF